MVAVKAKDVEAFVRDPKFAQKVILIYGPDEGLVAERADAIAKKTGVDLSDPFSLIRMDADEVAGDPSKVAEEAHTIGMFGGKRLIRISGTTRKDLAKAIVPVLEVEPKDSIILIEAGDLKKSSGLRKKLEASKAALCLPCFQDNNAALEQLIKEEIVSAGLQIDQETKQALKALLGDNRMLSRGELSKLALYCHGKSKVTLEDVHSVVGDASALVLDDVVDAVATGNPAKLQQVLPKALEAGHVPDMVTLAVMRHFQMIHAARSKVEQHRQPAASVVSCLRPPIHFSRKDATVRAVSIWDLEKLGRALARLDRTMLDCRKQSGAAASICGMTFLSLSVEAQSLARRR